MLIVIGVCFDDCVIGDLVYFVLCLCKIIYIDIDLLLILKCVKVDILIVGDVKEVLKELIE